MLQNVTKNCLTKSKIQFPRAPTPVKWLSLLPWLEMYPDQEKTRLIYYGFKVGFDIPEYPGLGCAWVNNSKSVNVKKDIVRQKIFAEIAEGRIAGPFSSLPFSNIRISPLAIVPKKEPNSYRLIHNLSYLDKSSHNYFTDKSNALINYASFDDALSFLTKLGQDALMAKADIKSVFKLLPINPFHMFELGSGQGN